MDIRIEITTDHDEHGLARMTLRSWRRNRDQGWMACGEVKAFSRDELLELASGLGGQTKLAVIDMANAYVEELRERRNALMGALADAHDRVESLDRER